MIVEVEGIMYRVSFTITDGKTNVTEEITTEFSPEEWEILQEYDEFAKELVSIKLLQTKQSLSYTMRASDKNGFEVEGDIPPWDEVIGLLHKIRPFFLENERTNFYRICSILGKRINNENFRKFLGKKRDLYSGKNFQRSVVLWSNDVILNSEGFLKDWLYAYEYHRDKNKRHKIEGLHEIVPVESSKPIIVFLLYDKARAIVEIWNLIVVILKNQMEQGTCS